MDGVQIGECALNWPRSATCRNRTPQPPPKRHPGRSPVAWPSSAQPT